MKTIYFVRHGESEANAGGVSRPDKLLTLSEKGKQQAQAVADTLPRPACVLASEMWRTQQTAQPFCAKWQISAQIQPLLNEFSYLDFALIDGLTPKERQTISQAYWAKADPHFRTGQAVDSFADFAKRVADFMAFAPALPDQTVCFGHGIWIAMLAYQLENRPLDMAEFRAWQLAQLMPNTAVWQLTLSSTHTTFTPVNDYASSSSNAN